MKDAIVINSPTGKKLMLVCDNGETTFYHYFPNDFIAGNKEQCELPAGQKITYKDGSCCIHLKIGDLDLMLLRHWHYDDAVVDKIALPFGNIKLHKA